MSSSLIVIAQIRMALIQRYLRTAIRTSQLAYVYPQKFSTFKVENFYEQRKQVEVIKQISSTSLRSQDQSQNKVSYKCKNKM